MEADPNKPGVSSKSGFLQPAVLIVVVFVVSRCAAYICGIRFDLSYIYVAMQALDVDLLQHRLIESIWNLHAQPPLFNLFVGAFFKCFPHGPHLAFHVAYLAIGITLGLSMLALAGKLGMSPRWAVCLTLLFILNPTTILFENALFYDYPTTCLLCIAAFMAAKWEGTGKWSYGWAFFMCVGLTAMTRSLFQLAWIGLVFIPPLVFLRIGWKRVLAAAAIPVLLVVGWQVKNYYQFGVPTTSSWLGMNLTRNTVERLSKEEKERLIKQGILSAMAAVPVYDEFDAYRGHVTSPASTGVPALDRKMKNPPGVGPNYNYLGYIEVSRRRMKDAVAFIRARPAQFARNVLDAMTVYVKPAGHFFIYSDNWNKLSRFRALYNIQDKKEVPPRFLRALIAMCYALLICYGAYLIFIAVRNRPTDGRPVVTIAFMWVTLVYAFLVTNLTDIWENHRIRFMTDPFVWIMMGMLISRVFKRYFPSPAEAIAFPGAGAAGSQAQDSGISSGLSEATKTIAAAALVFTIFFFLILTLYYQGLNAPLVYDSKAIIAQRGEIFDSPGIMSAVGYFSNRPLFMLSLILNYATTGVNPFYFRLLSVGMAAACGAVLFLLIHTALSATGSSLRERSALMIVVSLISSAVFILHPLQGLALLYVWQRSVIMACFFFCSALALYLAARSGAVRRTTSAYIAVSLMFAAGMLCKEIIIVLPAAFVLTEYVLLRRSLRQTFQAIPLIVSISLPPLIAYASAAHYLRGPYYITVIGHWDRICAYYETAGIGLVGVALTQARALVSYLSMIAAPWITGTPLVKAEALSSSLWNPLSTFGAVLLNLLFLTGAVVLIRIRPLLAFGALLFFISSIPESLLVPHYSFFGYRAILPMVGIILSLADILSFLIGKAQASRHGRSLVPLVTAAPILFVLCLGLSTYTSAKGWSPLNMWKTAYDTLPPFSDRVESVPYLDVSVGYGVELARAKRYEEAIEVLEKTAKIGLHVGQTREARRRNADRKARKPDSTVTAEKERIIGNELSRSVAAFLFMGLAHQNLGAMPKAIEAYTRAIEINPNLPGLYNNLGAALEKSGRMKEALRYYIDAARFTPPLEEACRNISRIAELLKPESEHGRTSLPTSYTPLSARAQGELGEALMICGKPKKALAYLRSALRIDPGDSRLNANMGLVLLKLGRISEAVEVFETALRDMKNDAALQNALGVALIQSGRAHEAIKRFKKALALDPGHQGAATNLQKALKLNQ